MAVAQRDVHPVPMTVDAAQKGHTGAQAFEAIAGEALSQYDVVYISGDLNAATLKVSKASTLAVTSSRTPLFVALHAANAAGDKVRIGTFVAIPNQNTGANPAGTPIYLSNSTAGARTLTSQGINIQIGVVGKAGTSDGIHVLMPQAQYSTQLGTPMSTAAAAKELFVGTVAITGGTTGSPYSVTLPPGNFEVLDAWVQCRAADAGGTAQVTDASNNAITDAMACATDTNVIRATTIDDARSTVTGSVRVAFAGGSAAGRGLVTILLVPRT